MHTQIDVVLCLIKCCFLFVTDFERVVGESKVVLFVNMTWSRRGKRKVTLRK
jgi:hypothetical protein